LTARIENPIDSRPAREVRDDSEATGSRTCVKTIGIDAVAFLAARAASVETVTTTSTFSLTSSAAKLGAGRSCLGESPLNEQVLALDVAVLAEALH